MQKLVPFLKLLGTLMYFAKNIIQLGSVMVIFSKVSVMGDDDDDAVRISGYISMNLEDMKTPMVGLTSSGGVRVC